MIIDLLSLFPDYFESPFKQSMIKRAQEKGILTIRHVDIRDFASGKHAKVDDRPFGGGPGMVMKPEPLVKALRSVKHSRSHVVYLSPQGAVLTARKCRELASKQHLILISGHYEGIDQRVVEMEVDEEISIGDYVLTSGLAPALVLVDATCRFLPDFLGDERSWQEDSFEGRGGLDTPHYTRPRIFEGKQVPSILLNGNHEEIAKWRARAAEKKTCARRPDLYKLKRK